MVNEPICPTDYEHVELDDDNDNDERETRTPFPEGEMRLSDYFSFVVVVVSGVILIWFSLQNVKTI